MNSLCSAAELVPPLNEPRLLAGDFLCADEVAGVGVKEAELAEHVEEGAEIRHLLTQPRRRQEILEQRLRGVAGGLGQHDGVEPAQPKLVACAFRTVRHLAEQMKGRFETRDDIPVGAPIVRAGGGLLEVGEGTPAVAAAPKVRGQLARNLGRPARVPSLQALADLLVQSRAPVRRKAVVDGALIQGVPERIARREHSIWPLSAAEMLEPALAAGEAMANGFDGVGSAADTRRHGRCIERHAGDAGRLQHIAFLRRHGPQGALQALLVRSRHIGVRSRSPGANPELVTAYRTQKMLKLALAIAYGAFVRTESRGAHFREDYPRRNDAEWLKRTLARWNAEQDTLPTLTYETLDVSTMELPPGWRGYGAKDYIDHPDTPARQQTVDALKAELAPSGRFVVQEALMPYGELLPPRFRGRNERIDERF